MTKYQRITPATLILGHFSIFTSCLIFGWNKTWSFLQIPTMTPFFADMRTVQGSLYSISLGLDPQIINPGDPWGRVMNYPSIWMDIANFLNLQIEANYLIFIALQISLFLTCLTILTIRNGSLAILLLCFSNSTLLCLERGNNDLLIFSFVFLALNLHNLISVLLVIIATLLKLYPILVLPAFITNLRIFLLMVLGSILSVVIITTELTKIKNGTPVAYGLAYGSAAISEVLKLKINLDFSAAIISTFLIAASIIVFILNNSKMFLETEKIEPVNKKMFIAGGCIYVGTFLFSSNFDYRLIFLILCVPLMIEFTNLIIKFIFIISIFISSNYIFLNKALGTIGSLINLTAKVLLFVLILAVLFQFTHVATKKVFINKFTKSIRKDKMFRTQ